jgi:ADP-heptose:LPS heptosyltransferase
MPSPRKILIFRLGAMGDILFTTPALRALKAAYPASHITCVLLRQWAFLMRRNPQVDRVIGIPYCHPKATRHLTRERFDLLLNFYDFENGAQLCESIPATERRGSRWIDGRLIPDEHSRFLAKDKALKDELQRAGLSYAELYCRIAGVPADSLRMDFDPGPWARLRARWLLRRHGLSAPIALHLHSRGSRSRSWSVESALRVVRQLPDRRFLVLGYRADRAATLRLESEPNVSVTFAPAPVQAALLAHCSLFVGIDSGPRQLASAMGIPTLTLCGPQPFSFLPPDPKARCLTVDCPDAPCFEESCPRGAECLSHISAEQVVQAILEI